MTLKLVQQKSLVGIFFNTINLLCTSAAANGNGSGGNETSNSPLDLILSSSLGRPSGNVLLNCVQPPKGHGGLHRKAREPSPDLIEIQAQIEAIR